VEWLVLLWAIIEWWVKPAAAISESLSFDNVIKKI
jgi:hypothetical protein